MHGVDDLVQKERRATGTHEGFDKGRNAVVTIIGAITFCDTCSLTIRTSSTGRGARINYLRAGSAPMLEPRLEVAVGFAQLSRLDIVTDPARTHDVVLELLVRLFPRDVTGKAQLLQQLSFALAPAFA